MSIGLEIRLEDTKDEKLEKEAIAKYREYKTEKEKAKEEKRKKKGKKSKKKKSLLEVPDYIDFSTLEVKGDGSEATGGSRRKKKDVEKDTYEYYKERFESELEMYDDLLAQAVEFEMQARGDLDKFRNSGVRSTKVIADMYSNVITAKKSVADLVKERLNIKKLSSDLEQKQARLNTSNDKGSDSGNVGASLVELYKKIQSESTSIPDFSTEEVEYNYEGGNDFDPDLALEAELENMEFSDSEMNTKYDHLNPEIQIIRNEDTGDWKFIAVDELDNTLDDFVLPDRESVGGSTLKFDHNKGYVEDRYGRTYKFYDVEDMMYDTY